MNILMILPEFEEGGVERHVLWLSTELSILGHTVWVVTAGGRLEEKLHPEARVVHLPVHRKNPFTALFSALRIAALARREEIDVIHAHSRVPAWIAWWASLFSGKPWIVTAHDRYRKNAAIRPFLKADGAICVSEAVRSHLEGSLPARTVVIRNGIPDKPARWQKREDPGPFRFLFVGRLTRRKGLHVALSALSSVKGNPWVLDILGDGPQREELEAMAVNLGLEGKVFFHGFRDDVESWMASSDCLLFPSLDEGMPLVLMQAVRVGIPVLASAIDPVIELTGKSESLLPPGDEDAWVCGLSRILQEGKDPPRFDPSMVPLARQMAEQTGCFLKRMAVGKNAGKA
ncbi:MAG: glycosyltransferase family 4 protein [Synergistaceae bacterium]|nr:glycosyltransferase family 4 protein [Synergistaceae bacterium]